MTLTGATVTIDDFPEVLTAELRHDGAGWAVTAVGNLALTPGRRVHVRVTAADGRVWTGPAVVDGWTGEYRDDGRMAVTLQLVGVGPLDGGAG